MMQKREFTFAGLVKVILGLILRFITIYIPVSVGFLLSLSGGLSSAFHQDGAKPTLVTLVWVCVALAIADFLKDYYDKSSWKAAKEDDEIFLGTISKAIDRVVSSYSGPGSSNDERPIGFLLHSVESLTKLILKTSEVDGVAICANVMLPNEDGTKLRTRYWGSQLEGREDIELEVDIDSPLVGAPTAYASKRPVYVHDTWDEKWAQHFDREKPYRSILSIPIFGTNCTDVIGVLNIDSTVPNGFGETFEKVKLVVYRLKSLIHLIRLDISVFEGRS